MYAFIILELYQCMKGRIGCHLSQRLSSVPRESWLFVRYRVSFLLLQMTHPLHLPSKGSHHRMGSSLTIKIDVACRLDEGPLFIGLNAYRTSFPITSTVKLSVNGFNWNMASDAARSLKISQKTNPSSIICGISVVRCAAPNPGLKTPRHFFHSGPSMVIRSYLPAMGLKKFWIAGNLGRLCSWVICFAVDGDAVTRMGATKGQLSI